MSKLEKLQKVLTLLQEDTITPKELKQFVQLLLDTVKKHKEQLTDLSRSQIEKLEYALVHLDVKNSELQNAKKEVLQLIKDKASELKKITATKAKDGKDGVSPNPARVALEASKLAVEAIKPLIPQIEQIEDKLPILGQEIRDSLELLQGDERLDKSAIKGLDEELKKLSDRPIGGGTSAIGVRQTFKYIAHTEEPVGLINGVNTTYTVKNDIFYVFGFTLNGEQIAEIPNFTYTGRTLTFATALPSAYSGKDFEVKYIG